jgi:hypothetical protein
MPVFNKWNWTEASYKAAAFYQNEEKRANRSTIHKHLTYPVRFWCEQPRGYQVQSKLIRRTLSWLTAANRRV